jgi:hypothetical protein
LLLLLLLLLLRRGRSRREPLKASPHSSSPQAEEQHAVWATRNPLLEARAAETAPAEATPPPAARGPPLLSGLHLAVPRGALWEPLEAGSGAAAPAPQTLAWIANPLHALAEGGLSGAALELPGECPAGEPDVRLAAPQPAEALPDSPGGIVSTLNPVHALMVAPTVASEAPHTQRVVVGTLSPLHAIMAAPTDAPPLDWSVFHNVLRTEIV